MMERHSRHALVGVALAAVASLAMASDLGYVDAFGLPDGTAQVELLGGTPVLGGDLGEIVVRSTRARAGH